VKTAPGIRRLFTLLLSLVFLLCINSCKQDSGTKEGTQEEGTELDSSENIKTKESPKDVDQLDFPDAKGEEHKGESPEASADWPKIKSMGVYNFHPPLDGPLMQSGSFGELRGNHFHAGLDLRTGGTEGKNVYAIEDGIVSRIKVSSRGYGKVLYIRHGNGTTSVYGHLKQFNASIEAYVQKKQYEKRSYSIELFPGSALKVKRGEVIALSGNTGGSAGPHLHFEIRSSRSENTINPILYGIKIKDKLKPNLYNIMLYEKDEDYRRDHGIFPHKKYSAHSKLIKVHPNNYVFAAQMIDHQLDRMNKLGVHYMRITANGKLLFNTSIEKFAFDKSRYIQTHYDYFTVHKKGSTFTNLFLEKKNPLPFYSHHNKGILEVKHSDTISIEIKLADCTPNIRTMKFTLIGDSTAAAFPRKKHTTPNLIARSWKNSNYNSEDLRIDIPAVALYRDASLSIRQEPYAKSPYSDLFRVHKDLVPLQTYYSLRIKVKNIEGIDPSKLLIVNLARNGRRISEGGSYSGGWVKTKTRSFGNYYVGIDTIAPVAKVSISNRNIYVRVSDNLAGVDRYIASVDDQWILLEYHPNMGKMVGTIPDWVKSGEHLFELKVWDSRGNKTHKKFNIKVQ